MLSECFLFYHCLDSLSVLLLFFTRTTRRIARYATATWLGGCVAGRLAGWLAGCPSHAGIVSKGLNLS